MSDEVIPAPEPEAPADPVVVPEPVVIDLDAIRAANAAETEVGPVVHFNGTDYTLPARLPLRVLSNVAGLMRGSFVSLNDTFIALLGEQVANELFATLNSEDVKIFLEQVGAAYGVSLGN